MKKYERELGGSGDGKEEEFMPIYALTLRSLISVKEIVRGDGVVRETWRKLWYMRL